MADDGQINYISVAQVPGQMITNRAYNASNQVEYLGTADKGTANSDNRWMIRKYTYSTPT